MSTLHRTEHPAPGTQHLLLCLLPPPHLNTDRRTHESKLFADLSDEKPFVGKVERCGDVRKEHERWRSHTDLRDIHDPDVTTLRAARRRGRGHGFDALVQQRRRHTAAPNFSDL